MKIVTPLPSSLITGGGGIVVMICGDVLNFDVLSSKVILIMFSKQYFILNCSGSICLVIKVLIPVK